MRYQNPSLESSLLRLKNEVSSIKVIPLFPQYASASTGSVYTEVMRIVSKWQVIPKMDFVSSFFDHESFLNTIVDNARKKMDDYSYDHFVFSYHGLPERHIYKAGISCCSLGDCCNKCDGENRYCYRAQCFETSRLLLEKLNLPDNKFTVAFQSRLGKDPWIQPYTDQVLKDLATRELKTPTTSGGQVALADGWYGLAQTSGEAIKGRALQRAHRV